MSSTQSLKPKANWMAWTLQLIVGFVLGFVFGLLLIAALTERRFRPSSLSTKEFSQLALGIGLIVGSFASQYGDLMWLRFNYKLYPPESPKQNKVTTGLSIIIGVLGIGLLTYALMMLYAKYVILS